MLLAVAAASGPARCGTLAPSVSIVVMQDLGALHARSLLDQLERQFREFPTAADRDAAEQAIRKTMAELESKDAFTDWTAYQGLRLYRWNTESGPLMAIAIWKVFHDRLKAKDESLLRIRLVQEHRKRGLVPIDPADRLPEPEPTFRQENELAARVYEVDLYLRNIRTGVAYFTMFEPPYFDIENPIVARIFDPEFVVHVKADLARRNGLRPAHRPNSDSAAD
jgi:hypothetical protein